MGALFELRFVKSGPGGLHGENHQLVQQAALQTQQHIVECKENNET